MWYCTGSDKLTFTDIDAVLVHQQINPSHVVEEKPDQEAVGVVDFGMVVLRGPDGRIKQVTEFS